MNWESQALVFLCTISCWSSTCSPFFNKSQLQNSPTDRFRFLYAACHFSTTHSLHFRQYDTLKSVEHNAVRVHHAFLKHKCNNAWGRVDFKPTVDITGWSTLYRDLRVEKNVPLVILITIGSKTLIIYNLTK